jgi:RNA polymerase sigma-70 factor (ECF subfamily)
MNALEESTAIAEFEAHRPHLLGIAYRMTGTLADAEDLVQDAWLRWQAVDRAQVANTRAFLATTVSRLALDQMKSARARREQYVGQWLPEPAPESRFAGEGDPGHEAELRETLSYAFLVVLERLNPIERAVFLLRDVFDYDYREIAGVVDRSEAACRQAAHRARAHLREARPRFDCGYQQRLQLLQAFARAVGNGDMEGLTALLADDVVSISDGGGKAVTAMNPILGPDRVARLYIGAMKKEPIRVARHITVNGVPAMALYRRDRLSGVYFVEPGLDGRIAAVYAVRNPDKLRAIGID